jgi:hypothetical protein
MENEERIIKKLDGNEMAAKVFYITAGGCVLFMASIIMFIL